jgi:CubicO group peptidase (beta-lactamase class C family)
MPNPRVSLSSVDALIRAAVADGASTGVAVSVRTLDGISHAFEWGHAEVCPRLRPVREGQAWDLASLTKVLGTASVCMALVDQGVLDLDAPLSDLLDGAPEGVTPRHCLSHGSLAGVVSLL